MGTGLALLLSPFSLGWLGLVFCVPLEAESLKSAVRVVEKMGVGFSPGEIGTLVRQRGRVGVVGHSVESAGPVALHRNLAGQAEGVSDHPCCRCLDRVPAYCSGVVPMIHDIGPAQRRKHVPHFLGVSSWAAVFRQKGGDAL